MKPSPVHPRERTRLVVVSVFLLLLYCSLVVQFYRIQIMEGDKWVQVALAQHQHIAVEPFRRGTFYSNTSIKKGHPEEEQPIVLDIQKFHLLIDPDSIPPSRREKIAGELGSLLRFSHQEIGRIRKELEKKSRSRKIASWLDRKQKEEIEQWWKGFSVREKIARNALFFQSDYRRSYPFGSLLGAVLHTVREERDPETHQAIPTGGLELLYDAYLKGKEGKRLSLRTPRHPLGMGKVLQLPEDGCDIYLTINHYLQAIAEAELEKGVQAARAKGGWALLMDPHTGEILALAQVPSFDPSRYAAYFNDPRCLELTRVRAVSDAFEPGSIFKPLTVAVCLKANEELIRQGKKPLFSPEEMIPTSQGWFPGRSTPLKDGRVHQYLNLYLALQKSSNVYMARLTHRLIDTMGEQWYRKTLVELFGLGQKTQLGFPAENPGQLPTPGKLHPNGKLEWSLPTPYSLAIGHNVLINSIQMVRAFALIANGGFSVEPHLIRKIVKPLPDGTRRVLVDFTENLPKERVLSAASCKTLTKGLKYVTKEGGTSKRADILGYTEAGKSGTSEKIIDGQYTNERFISSFLGFAPADQPRFVLLVSLDEPEVSWIPGVGKTHHGGVCAAPIFREIATKALHYLGVAPDDPFGYPVGDPRRDPSKADWVREVDALKKVYEEWNR